MKSESYLFCEQQLKLRITFATVHGILTTLVFVGWVTQKTISAARKLSPSLSAPLILFGRLIVQPNVQKLF